MKRMKKLFALLLTLAMVMGMTVTAFAAEVPTAADNATATVVNVEAGATVTAYQVVKANYNDAGFTGYSAVEGLNITDATAPTSDEITAIAKGDLSNLTAVPMTGNDTTYTANLTAGYWMVLVSGTVEEVYNPMLVGVYYSVGGSDKTLATGQVDANTNWTLETVNAYAKSTKPTIDKEIVGGDKDVAVGSEVPFKITTAIPSYSKQYETVAVTITDTLDGLTLNEEGITVTVGGAVVAEAADTYGLETSATGFSLSFVSSYALANSGKEVVVTYSAVLNEDAGVNFDPNTNTATLEYTRNPGGDTKEVEDKTYTYTFGIDAYLNGEGSERTDEIFKGYMVSGEEKDVFTKLEGATFTLTNKESGKVYTDTSDKEGYLEFKGLDEGEYTLVETVAPAGFSVNTTEIPVVISAEYNDNGTLKSYTVTVNGTKTSTYTATYEADSTTVKTITGDSDTEQVLNTRLSELPSTGGIGTTIFTIGGCAIMIAAAFFFFASRRKETK